MKKIINLISSFILLTLLTSCGGGGGGGGNVTINPDGNDGDIKEAPKTITADAGADQTGSTGSTIRLNATDSNSTEDVLLNYTWSIEQQPISSKAILSDASAINPTFTADADGTYVVKVTVFSEAESQQDTVIIRSFSPIANAGDNQMVGVGAQVLLDASLSKDETGASINYQWQISLKPTESNAVIPVSIIENPTFVTDVSGTYVISLIVNNGIIDSIPDTLTVTAVPPTADAGQDQSISTNSQIELDGSASSDFSLQSLDYFWQMISRPDNSLSKLLISTSPNPTFIPDVDGPYVLGLVVDNGTEKSIEDTVLIISGTQPIAIAGKNQQVSVEEEVLLDGSQSDDANETALTYKWVFTKRPAKSNAFLNNFTSTNSSFTPDIEGNYTVSLIVMNGSEQSEPSMLNVVASLPIAKTAGDQNVAINSSVLLNANPSSDPNKNELTYLWEIIDFPVGSAASFSDVELKTPTFTADLPGKYTVELIVNNSFVDSLPQTVNINARMTVGENSGIYSTSFEGTSVNDWSASSGVWEIGKPDGALNYGYVGENLAATNLTGNYVRNNSVLSGPAITMPTIDESLEKFELSFWHFFDLGVYAFNNKDIVAVYIKKKDATNNWEEWVELQRFTGTSGGWSRFSFDIASTYSGETIKLGLAFISCVNFCAVQRAGWYIDEILLEAVSL